MDWLINRFRLVCKVILLAAVLTVARVGAVEVPSAIDHGEYDRLLKKYVDAEGLVAYSDWRVNAADMAALDEYLARFAPAPIRPATGDEKAAALINAYNAFTIQMILNNYPVESIWRIENPFEGKRHRVGGTLVSLDDIEHGTLRPLIGYKAHAVLVCAARSCPPLQRFAYTAGKLDEQIDTAFEAWLSRPDLNSFHPAEKKVEISKIFDWFSGDFKAAGGVKRVLSRHAPDQYRDFLARGNYRVRHRDYHWGLNDQSDLGIDYKRGFWEKVRGAF